MIQCSLHCRVRTWLVVLVSRTPQSTATQQRGFAWHLYGVVETVHVIVQRRPLPGAHAVEDLVSKSLDLVLFLDSGPTFVLRRGRNVCPTQKILRPQ